MTRFLDEAHQKHRAMEDALNKTGLKPHWLMNVVSLNVPHGPWNDDHRWNEVRDMQRKRCSTLSLLSHEDALLDEFTTRIHHEMVTYDGAICARSDRDAFVRDAIKARSTGAALKGYQCNFKRFLGTFHESNKQLSQWTTSLYERTLVGLEGDMMKGASFNKNVVGKHSC